MQTYFDSKDNRKCEIIFEENGTASLRLSATEVRYHVPVNRLRTAEQQAAWLLIHPKGREHMHTVLEVVDAAKRCPRTVDETDEPWMANLRSMCNINANVKENPTDMTRFEEQYGSATGESTDKLFSRPGVSLRHRGGYANFLYITIPRNCDLTGCPEEIHTDATGDRTINNTRFIWRLIAREGFRLDL